MISRQLNARVNQIAMFIVLERTKDVKNRITEKSNGLEHRVMVSNEETTPIRTSLQDKMFFLQFFNDLFMTYTSGSSLTNLRGVIAVYLH